MPLENYKSGSKEEKSGIQLKFRVESIADALDRYEETKAELDKLAEENKIGRIL